MSYLDLLEEEGENAQFLCVLKPARRVETWTLDPDLTSTYVNDFDFGYVVAVKVNGVALTEAASSTLTAGKFYYDHETATLYIRKSDSSAPDASDYVVVTYELHIGTFDAHWFRVPTDDTTTEVYFDPVISASPDIKSSISDLLFGVMPTSSTSIALINAEHIFEKHLYDSSFIGREISVYHWLGDNLDTDNIKLVFQGRMGNCNYNGGRASIQIFDSTNIFQKEVRSTGDVQFFNTTDFPSVNPDFVGKPIRTVYGRVDGFVPVNVSFVRDNPTTSNNRTWAVRADGGNLHALSSTVAASPASTATRTYISPVGYSVGDTFKADKTTDEYGIVTALGADYIEHAAFASGACSPGDTISRGTTSRIDIVQAGVKYTALFGRDYTESVHASGTLQFVFSSSLESNLSMPETLSAADLVFARVYGKKNNVTLSGSPFGGNSTTYGNLTNIAVILFDVLKTFQGLSEDEMVLSSFTDLLASASDEIGFAISAKAQDPYTKTKEVILDILGTGLLKLYIDFDQKWKVSQMGPNGASDKSITEDEILKGTISYEFEYSDIYSDFVVSYGYQELSEDATERTSKVSQVSDYAKFVHEQSKTFEHKSLHIDAAGAQVLADRLSFVLGDRQGNYSFETKNRFFDNVVGDIVEVQSEKLPGFEFDADVENSRSFSLTQIEKSLRKVKLRVSDQKGIEDNSGAW